MNLDKLILLEESLNALYASLPAGSIDANNVRYSLKTVSRLISERSKQELTAIDWAAKIKGGL